jgi:hypothetical protein
MMRVVVSGLALVALFTHQIYSAEVWIISDTAVAPVRFASSDIATALALRNNTVSQRTLADVSAGTGVMRVIVGVLSNTAVVSRLSAEGGAPVTGLKPQGYAVRVTGTVQKSYWVIGGDSIGALYGGLALADAVRYNTLGTVTNSEQAPYISHRGIKFNIPLDARTPSYSDGGESAWNNVETVWDFAFWKDFMEQMARNRFNVLSLWNLQPFPSLIKHPDYANVALSDVKKNTVVFEPSTTATGMTPSNVLANLVTVKTMTIDEKIAFWRKVMSYGRDLGISFYVYTWNIYLDGVYSHPELTTSLGNAATKDFYRKGVRELFSTYPLLAGVGITAGEQMTWNAAQDEPWMWSAYGLGCMDAKAQNPGRTIKLVHRAHVTSPSTIFSNFQNYSDTMDLSVKYSHDRLYCSIKPTYGLGVINGLPADKKTWLEFRNDDYCIMRWGDPEFVRAYIQNIPSVAKIAGFNMGSDSYIWAREFSSTEPDVPKQSYINKHWYSFMLWGRLFMPV